MDTQINEDQFKTPMMIQYLEIKKQYPDCILFFRLGDFYEMFLDDAKVGAEVLDITLTARSRGKDGAIPMCGVPFHAVDSYLAKLVGAGYKVAICDQTSLPDGKGLVDREVIRVITPGTNLNNRSLEKKNNNYILVVDYQRSDLAIIICDLGTGEVSYIEENNIDLVSAKQVIDDLFSKIKPIEGLVNEKFYCDQDKMVLFNNYPDFYVYSFDEWRKHSKLSRESILDLYKVKSLKSLNLEDRDLVQQVLGVLIGYLKFTQKVDLKHLQKIEKFVDDHYLEMDRSTINNLELLQTLSGNKKNSLLDLIDFTYTGMGGRLLKKWLVKPLFDQKKIEYRHRLVEKIIFERELKEEIQQSLRKISDIERTTSRLSLNFGSPRDLISLKNSLQEALFLSKKFEKYPDLKKIFAKHPNIKKVIKIIGNSIIDDPPVNPKNGGFIRSGIDKKLDELKNLTLKSRDWMDKFEQEERKKTGISSLKVKFNKVFGFYIEISKANLHLAPDRYDRKQTLVNAERFITKELKHHEQIVLEAEEQIFTIEYLLFLKTTNKVLAYVQDIQLVAQEIATLDCLLSFSLVALELNFSKPEMTRENIIDIKGGRHPVIEKIIGKHNFVPNETLLDQKQQQLIIITGPNMAGKSVLMRQTALIVLLAHIGSFVPAREAKISLTDKIFVRSGASDAITEGLSTFMVEMIETARILNNATKDSLVIMDEIGRGTSTYDGISIAWSVAERLVTNKVNTPKTLFATHYHELQELEEKFPKKISNFRMAIKNHQSEPVFLYLFSKGEGTHSFGIQVAKLAGLPKPVIKRAQTLMKKFDKDIPNIDLEEIKNEEKLEVNDSKLLKELKKINVNKLTPLEALNKLHQLVDDYGKN
jgi:DNA mismatch repair protein MutS